ncbi:MAG: hypothetical protein FD174_4113 [Geobacteraceae bacterium]|nr:MAG: hypothetical protein FD174_4113 [Geobacteraceae bacterium]
METTKRWGLSGRASGLVTMALLLTLAGCATVGSGSGPAVEGRTIWKVRDQHVSIVPQERAAGLAVAANDQPVDLPAGELHRLLAAVRVLPRGASAPLPLFTETELQVLEDAAASGLRQAGPTEEVVFAVFGYHQALYGLAKEQKVTTGRLFYQGGTLNLLLGTIQRDVNDREDRRLYPFQPGSRQGTAELGGRVMPADGEAGFTLKRDDWLTFAVGSGTAAPATVAPAATTPAPPPPTAGPAKKSPKGIEERLLLLNELKGKQLITEDEYRAKRREILNEL